MNALCATFVASGDSTVRKPTHGADEGHLENRSTEPLWWRDAMTPDALLQDLVVESDITGADTAVGRVWTLYANGIDFARNCTAGECPLASSIVCSPQPTPSSQDRFSR